MSQLAVSAQQHSVLKHHQLSALDNRFLHWIYELHYATIPQIVRLQYHTITRSNCNKVAARLKLLDEKHLDFLQRGYLARAVKLSRNPSVFRLARRGIALMETLGLFPLPKFKPADPFPSPDRLLHTLSINDIIIAAKQLVRFLPDYALPEFRHDWMLKTTPIPVHEKQRDNRKRGSVIPDIWLDFYLPQLPGMQRPPNMPLHVEVDTGTETNVQNFRARLHQLLAYLDGPYEAFFRTPAITLLFATTAGNLRVRKLLTWIEAVLTETGRKQDSLLFYCTSLSHARNPRTNQETEELNINPHQLFLEPVWYTPFDTSPKILLDATLATECA